MTVLDSPLQNNLDMKETATAVSSQRRYDIDWLRTLALALLIIYHTTISFQPWASFIGFPQNDDTLELLWVFMALLNVWRIPILFLISGMGVRFAMERRDWKALLKDRTIRILLPLVFGMFFIVPTFIYFILKHYGQTPQYAPALGHLWFLANIYAYVLLLLPIFFYLKNHPNNFVLRALSALFRKPFMILLVALPVMLEAWLVDPEIFSAYAETTHGFWLGMICFFLGFLFITLKDVFWTAVSRIRWLALGIAFPLYLLRFLIFQFEGAPNMLIALESMCWMLAVVGFGSLYLNKPSKSLSYFSGAVYPVYIIHMTVLFALLNVILPLDLPALVKFASLLAGTFGISLFLYEFVLKRIKWIRPLFGMKFK